MTAPSAAPLKQSTAEQLLQRLEWRVIRRLDGLLQGDYRTLFYGTGTDFADLREYEPRDDIRHIDWNVTARMNTPYVRQYVEDREVTAWFLLDRSRSMGFGTPTRPKKLIQTEFVGTLARLLTRNGNRVGAILYNNRLEETIPPRSSRQQVLRIMHQLLKRTTGPVGKSTNLTELLAPAMSTLKRRALVFVISDFLSEPGWERSLALLNRRHEVIAIRLWDPSERDLPDVGMLAIEDAESGQQLIVDTSDPHFRRRFYEVVMEREDKLQQLMRQSGTDYHAISTTEDLVPAIVQMAALRKRRR